MNINRKIHIDEFLFFVSYGIYVFFSILNHSFYARYISGALFKGIMVCCIILIFLKELFRKKISKRELLYFGICISLTFILLIRIEKIVMLPFFFILFGARKIEFKKIAKFTIIETAVLMIVIVLSAKYNIILNVVEKNAGRTRNYLGFRYPLIPQILLFNITALYLYLNKEKKGILRFIILGIVNYILFLNTQSRLSFIQIILLIAIFIVLKLKPNLFEKKRLICLLMTGSFIICSIFSIIVIINYNPSNSFFKKINEFSENRVELGKKSLNQYNINLLGNKVHYIGNGLDIYGNKENGKYNYVDCLYLNMLERYGIIFGIVLVILLTYTTYKAWENKDYHLLSIFTLIALHGLIDDLNIYLYFNTFWFVISESFVKVMITKLKKNMQIANHIVTNIK